MTAFPLDMLEGVQRRVTDRDPRKRALGAERAKILNREVKRKMAYAHMENMDEPWGKKSWSATDLEDAIRKRLPEPLRGIAFRVDMARQTLDRSTPGPRRTEDSHL